MRHRFILFAILAANGVNAGESRISDRGEVRFVPSQDEGRVAERFRLVEHTFAWQATRLPTVTASFEVWDVTFPSPIQTPQESNNTVWCEYYQSNRAGKKPGVIVLHILGGDFELSRLFCRAVEVLESVPGAIHWFKNPIQALGWATPLAYARTSVGLRELENILGRIEHGVYSCAACPRAHGWQRA